MCSMCRYVGMCASLSPLPLQTAKRLARATLNWSNTCDTSVERGANTHKRAMAKYNCVITMTNDCLHYAIRGVAKPKTNCTEYIHVLLHRARRYTYLGRERKSCKKTALVTVPAVNFTHTQPETTHDTQTSDIKHGGGRNF